MDAINSMALALAHLAEASTLLAECPVGCGGLSIAPAVVDSRKQLHRFLMTALDAEASNLERDPVWIRPERIPF